jgi:hypothetical protein
MKDVDQDLRCAYSMQELKGSLVVLRTLSERYMALNDLQSEVRRSSFVLDDSIEVQHVCALVLRSPSHPVSECCHCTSARHDEGQQHGGKEPRGKNVRSLFS